MGTADRTQKLAALGALKDWSNYQLVVTVAALGWVSSGTGRVQCAWVVWLLAASAIFGMLTLALIPIITERFKDDETSIYDVRAPFRLFWMWRPVRGIYIKWVCWPQHLLFMLGVIVYAANYP